MDVIALRNGAEYILYNFKSDASYTHFTIIYHQFDEFDSHTHKRHSPNTLTKEHWEFIPIVEKGPEPPF